MSLCKYPCARRAFLALTQRRPVMLMQSHSLRQWLRAGIQTWYSSSVRVGVSTSRIPHGSANIYLAAANIVNDRTRQTRPAALTKERRSDDNSSDSNNYHHPRFSRATCRTSVSLAKFGLVPGAFLYEHCSETPVVKSTQYSTAATRVSLDCSTRSWYLTRHVLETSSFTSFVLSRSLHTDSESNKDPMCGVCGRAAPMGDGQHRQLRDSRVMPSDPSSRLRIAAPNDPKALPEPSFDPLYFYHYGSRQEILREITGFFPRLRARLRRALKGSYQKRPWTIDDVFALATWVIMSQAMLLLIGTTTTVSVILWTLNRLQYQDWIARKLSDWVSSALGVAVSFESAIVPAWRRGAIRLKNVKIYCGPEHGSLLDGGDRDTNFTNYKLQIDQIDVTLSLWRWMDDRGLIRECAMRGVRGVVDRRLVWWDPEITYSPSESRRARLPGVFDLDSLDIEDMLLTVHPWQNFRPITVSIYSASLPRFRDRWMLYDALNANSIVGMYDGSLFTIHQAHQHLHPHSLAMHTAGLYGYDGQPRGDRMAEGAEAEVGARTTHVQVEGLNIDHINSGVDGPVGWITSGRLNVSALVNFPTQPSATDPAMAIRKIVDNINDSIDVVILPSMPDWSNPEKSPNSLVRALYHLDMVDSPLAQEMHDRFKRRAERESQRRLEKQRQRTASWSQPLAPIPSHLIGGVLQHTVKPTAHADAHSIETLPRALEDPTAVHVDLQVEFNDIRASVPLSMPALGYPLLSAVLVRPIVAYMNAHRTSLPMRCQLRLRLDDFDGAWSFWDSGADSLITQGIGAAFAQLVQNERERNRRLKLVGWWSVTAIARQCARLADFVYSQRSFFSYLGVAPETDRI